MAKYQLCGRNIPDVDIYETSKNKEILEQMVELCRKYDVFLLMKSDEESEVVEYKVNEYKIVPDELHMTMSGETVHFYDTLDDEFTPLVLKGGMLLSKQKFRISKMGYVGRILTSAEFIKVDKSWYGLQMKINGYY